jgi:hypothetical protein
MAPQPHPPPAWVGATIAGEAPRVGADFAPALRRAKEPAIRRSARGRLRAPGTGGESKDGYADRNARRLARNPGRTSRGGAFSPASLAFGFRGSASGRAPKDARRRSSGTSA